MTEFLQKIRTTYPAWLKKYLYEYLDTRVVFLMDLVLSFFSSILVLFLVSLLSSSEAFYMGRFALLWMGASLLCSFIAILLYKNHKVVIRYSRLRDLLGIFRVSALKVLLMLAVLWLAKDINVTILLALLIDALVTAVLLIGIRILMMMAYDVYKNKLKARQNTRRIFIYGTSDRAVSMVSRLANSTTYLIIGFLVPHSIPAKFKVADTPVFGYNDDDRLAGLIDRYAVSGILFPSEKDAQMERENLIRYCTENGLKALIAPGIDEVTDGRIMQDKVRNIRIDDLLGREEIKINFEGIRQECEDKVILVTGAAGSIGSELCRQLAGFGVRRLLLFDNAETAMHNLRLELEEKFPTLDFKPIIGDVRHYERLDYVFRRFSPKIVFHAAAYKHVPLMEDNPCEAVLVNVLGTRSLADKCIEYGVEKMVMVSTDKAVNPTNIMGCTKRLAEIYVQSLGLAMQEGKVPGGTKFITTRFGNVLGSNGSVIPHFREQIAKGGPVTVTDPRITRYFMTIPEACRLVMEAATISEGNQILVFDMGEPVKIDDLARKMISLSGFKVGTDIEIEYTGLRPGEKLYEEVLSDEENTDPTSNDLIRIARVRHYDYEEVCAVFSQLEYLALKVDIPEMVKLMKKTVPEYKSQNSRFCAYDTPEQTD